MASSWISVTDMPLAPNATIGMGMMNSAIQPSAPIVTV